MSTETVNPYGFCPKCGAPGKARERRLNGNDICTNNDTYPSSSAIYHPATKSLSSVTVEVNDTHLTVRWRFGYDPLKQGGFNLPLDMFKANRELACSLVRDMLTKSNVEAAIIQPIYSTLVTTVYTLI